MARRGIINKKAALKAFESKKEEKKIDERFFVPSKNSAGEISVRIRLLPAPDMPLPIVTVNSHYFDENGLYAELCPTTIDKPCPVCDTQRATWDNGDKQKYRDRKKSIKHYCNILVVKDPVVPENNGKVFLFKFTPKLLKKIQSKIHPAEDSLEESCLVYDYEEGADLNLIGAPDSFENSSGKVINYFSYDNSNFQAPAPLPEKVIDDVDAKLFNLAGFIDESKFKDYDTLKAKFEEVNGNTISGRPQEEPDEIKEPASANVAKIMDSADDSADVDEDFMAKMRASLDD